MRTINGISVELAARLLADGEELTPEEKAELVWQFSPVRTAIDKRLREIMHDRDPYDRRWMNDDELRRDHEQCEAASKMNRAVAEKMRVEAEERRKNAGRPKRPQGPQKGDAAFNYLPKEEREASYHYGDPYVMP